MPNTTPNLGLTTWLESDFVNFEDINDNFERIDDCIMCIESGTISSAYSGGSSAVASWRYKKYSDGTVDMSAKLEYTNLKCNGGTEAPYYSGTSILYFPFTFSTVYDVQMHLASNTIGWVSNITGPSVIDNVRFRVSAIHYETETTYKQIFINVKGVLAS